LKKENRGKGNKYLNILINEAQKDRRRRRRYFYLFHILFGTIYKVRLSYG
jgi:hypothetical protein